jgi:hypothetical protein
MLTKPTEMEYLNKQRSSSCPCSPTISGTSNIIPVVPKTGSAKVRQSPGKKRKLFKFRKRDVPLSLEQLSHKLLPMAYIGKRQTSSSYDTDQETKTAPVDDDLVMDEENSSQNQDGSFNADRLGSNTVQVSVDAMSQSDLDCEGSINN